MTYLFLLCIIIFVIVLTLVPVIFRSVRRYKHAPYLEYVKARVDAYEELLDYIPTGSSVGFLPSSMEKDLIGEIWQECKKRRIDIFIDIHSKQWVIRKLKI